MAYDAYGRPSRGGEPGSGSGSSYFESNDHEYTAPGYSSRFSTEPPRDNYQAERRGPFTGPEPKMSTPEIPPDLVATITEKIKKELMEHLKQTGSVDDQAVPLQREASNRSNSTSSPPPSSDTARRVYTPPSPAQPPRQSTYIPQPSNESARSPPTSPLDKPSGVRFSSDRARPSGAPRTFSTVELSTIDQKWGRLFDSDEKPTQRLGQFLRGLANHIIEDFAPKKNLVVTPNKMAAYYTDHAIDNEINPLCSIFKAQSNEQISRLYQDLGCQHHLVQDQSTMAPTIPALTPIGFAHWMTIFLLAYPDAESKRLEKVVLALPIDADGQMVDGKPERLPKQISRHLLPEKEDRKSRKLVEEAIANFFNDLGSSDRRRAAITPPSLSRHSSASQSRQDVRPRPVEIHQVKTSPTTSRGPPLERERNPYAGAPSTASETSSNEDSIKIERDRQPYSAQPGSGKVYADANPKGNSTKAPADLPEPRHHRTHSTTSQTYIPPPPPPRVSVSGRSRRTSSPPIKKYSDSTPDISGYKPGPSLSSTSSNPFTPTSYSSTSGVPPVDIRDPRERRGRDDRQYRRGVDDDARMTGEFNSPRDAERWDRFQEERRATEADRPERSYEHRSTISGDPRDTRAYEEWYREPSVTKSSGYDDRDRRY